MMIQGQEEKQFDDNSLKKLEGNEDFNTFLQEKGGSIDEFYASDFDEQYQIISEFYANVQALRHESV
jgi:hypothetical protein